MSVRVPGQSPRDGNQLASHLRSSLELHGLGPHRELPQLHVKVNVPHDAGPQLVAEAIARALRRRIG